MRQSVKHNEQRTVYVIHIYSKISVRLPRVSVGFSSLTRSASLGRSKWPLEPARSRKGARNGRSSSLGLAGALEMAAHSLLKEIRPWRSLPPPHPPRRGNLMLLGDRCV
jgi:hypothetical protein